MKENKDDKDPKTNDDKKSEEKLPEEKFGIHEKLVSIAKSNLEMQHKVVPIFVWALILAMVAGYGIIIAVGLELLKLPEAFLKYLIVPVIGVIASVFTALFKK
jgi:hypothetical protein